MEFRDMDFIDRIREMATRFETRVGIFGNEKGPTTEEATKNALVMPFINNLLGYNVFDPTEVVPEYTADIGVKKGETVDYAIMKDGNPVILFECKRYGSDLGEDQASQLRRYFQNVPTEFRFGVLTDGVTYRVYTDLDRPNIMDDKPFLEFNVLDFEESLAEELKKFAKASFDVKEIRASAKDLKYTREIEQLLAKQFNNPSDDFVRFLVSNVYAGPKTQAVIDQFRKTTKQALDKVIWDRINTITDKLKSAARAEEAVIYPDQQSEESAVATPSVVEEAENGIVTTADELEGYYVIKALLHGVVDLKRVTMRDMKTQCAILLDDTIRKPICRLHFDSGQKYLGLIDANKHEERVPIDDVDGIYQYESQLKATIRFYDS